MALTNAQIQAAYRARLCKDLDTASASRMDMVIDSASLMALKRLAAHQGVTQRAMLQKLIDVAQRALLNTLDGDQQDAYYDRVQAK